MRWKGKQTVCHAIEAALNTDSHKMNHGVFVVVGVFFVFYLFSHFPEYDHGKKNNHKEKDVRQFRRNGLTVGSCTLSETQAFCLS